MQTLHPQTRKNLLRAMRREAFAFAMYLLYATQARKHGRPEAAELFETVAREEHFGHFAEQTLDVGLLGMEAENLHLAIEQETFEADVMYRDFEAQTGPDGDQEAAERFRRLREDERRNRDQSLAVLQAMDPADCHRRPEYPLGRCRLSWANQAPSCSAGR
jgi:rubrerythrin